MTRLFVFVLELEDICKTCFICLWGFTRKLSPYLWVVSVQDQEKKEPSDKTRFLLPNLMSHFWDTGFDVSVKSLNLCRYTFWVGRWGFHNWALWLGWQGWSERRDISFYPRSSCGALLCFSPLDPPSPAASSPPAAPLPVCLLSDVLITVSPVAINLCSSLYLRALLFSTWSGGELGWWGQKKIERKKVDRWNISYAKLIDLTHMYHIVHLFHWQFNFNCTLSSLSSIIYYLWIESKWLSVCQRQSEH